MAVKGGPESDKSLARLLARLLGDQEWWDSVRSWRTDDAWRGANAQLAVDLYRRTGPIIETSLEPSHEVVARLRAVGVVREIADNAAMLSALWPEEARHELTLGRREVVDLMVRSDEIDRWAANLGHVLPMTASSIPDDVWPSESVEEGEYRSQFAEHVGDALRSYAVVEMWEEGDEETEQLRTDEMRTGICSLLSVSRNWVTWMRGRHPELEPAAVATLFAVQALFITTVESARREWAIKPGMRFIRGMLEDSDAVTWLVAEDEVLPEWLTD